MNKLLPTLLVIFACALPCGVADAADAPPPPDDMQSVAIATVHFPPDERSDTRCPRTGLGSLYWATRHPAQAWRVLLPIQDGHVTPADACDGTYRGEIHATQR
jgi:hypothetical protein